MIVTIVARLGYVISCKSISYLIFFYIFYIGAQCLPITVTSVWFSMPSPVSSSTTPQKYLPSFFTFTLFITSVSSSLILYKPSSYPWPYRLFFGKSSKRSTFEVGYVGPMVHAACNICLSYSHRRNPLVPISRVI